MSDENDHRVAGPPGDPGEQPAASPSPSPPPAAEAPVTTVPAVSRRERLRRAGARRPVQLLAAGVIGAVIGGAAVGALGAMDDHGDHGRFAEHGRRFGGPFMDGGGPYWRDGGPGWYGPGPGSGPGWRQGGGQGQGQDQGPDQGVLPASPVPVQPAPVSPAPTVTPSVKVS